MNALKRQQGVHTKKLPQDGCKKALLDHLNSMWPTIKFTVEVENVGSLPFLETLLRRKDDESREIAVYRKLTHTDWYLNFRSHHPLHIEEAGNQDQTTPFHDLH